MDDISFYKKYCTGCGLCHSIEKVEFKNMNGFSYPLLNENNLNLCKKICPSSGKYNKYLSNKEIFGKYQGTYIGYSTDDTIRLKASSGGMLTSICIYLLENKIVDGIIQTKADDNIVYKTKIVISRTKEDVLSCLGSRYSESHPLYNLLQSIKPNEKYAFVGKPCDIQSLKMYLDNNKTLKNQIIFTLSFFCAGEPSENAQIRLLKNLQINKIEECEKLDYRGNGWPGFATVRKSNGKVTKMSYNDSWGKILGRDVRLSCRYCLDGIGELSDISCGDLWYMNDDKTPDFSEHNGRNIVFARTEQGMKLLIEMKSIGKIFLNTYENINELFYIQKYQYIRRATMFNTLLALKLLGRKIPQYDFGLLRRYNKNISKKIRYRRFIGTLSRGLRKKI